MSADLQGNIAYGNGRTGEIVHVECWDAYIDSRRSYDVLGRPMPWGMTGTLYQQGAQKRELRGKRCAHCLKPF